MDKVREREILFEMLGDLVTQRRALTEEILLVRQQILKCDEEIKTHKEYMSAAEYVNIRNSIRRELETEMREQVRQEVLLEEKNKNNEVSEVNTESVIPTEVIEEAKFQENKKARKDIGVETIARVIKSFLKERGVPVAADEIYEYIQENRNHTWTRKSFNQLLWKVKQIDERIISASRGYYQYKH